VEPESRDESLTTMHAAPFLPAGLITLVLVSGCTVIHDRPASTGGHPVQQTVESAFPAYGLSFRQPAAWQSSTFDVVSSFSMVITYLSTQELHDPCVRSGDGAIECGVPTRQLRPGGVLVTWASFGMPGQRLASQPGIADEVGGHPARIVRGGADANCVALGGDISFDAAILQQRMNSHDQLLEMSACLRSPGTAQSEVAVQRMLDSVRFPAT
jgi:hypothetical protein